jgi:hypothetical protein
VNLGASGKEWDDAKSQYVGRRYSVVLSAKKGEISPTLARASHQAGQRKASEVEGMIFATTRPYGDPEAAARKLIEIANSVEAVQDGRIHSGGPPNFR